MGDTSETNTKVLPRELFLGVVALKTPIQKIIICAGMDPFPRYCHISESTVGLARAVSPTNINFRLTFLLTRLQEALYEDLAV